MYKLIIMCSIIFFNISAMHSPEQQQQEHVHILMQELVSGLKSDSIIIFPIKINNVVDAHLKRKESEKILSDIALNSIRVCLSIIEPAQDKTFLMVDNKVDNYEDNPAASHGLLCKRGPHQVDIRRTSLYCVSANQDFVIYNMPHYTQHTGCFDWAYGDDLFDFLNDKKEPCLVLIDENIYSKMDVMELIYFRFYGQKKILKYDRFCQTLEEYKPSFLNQIPFPIVIGAAILATMGLFYIMPPGLATDLDIIS